MKFYKVYAKKNENEKKEYLDISSGFKVLHGEFSTIMSIPFLNCWFLLKNKAFLYSFFLFLINIVSVRAIDVVFNFSYIFNEGFFVGILAFLIKYLLSMLIFYFIGSCGVFFEQKNLENKGFFCIFNSIAKNKKDAHHDAVKYITKSGEISVSI